MQRFALLAAIAVSALLAACSQRTEPPGDPGVCYHVVPQKGGKLKYNKLVNAPNLETCAANLEAMRLKFLRLGGDAAGDLRRLPGQFPVPAAGRRADLDQP